jgi:hypothetical protein
MGRTLEDSKVLACSSELRATAIPCDNRFDSGANPLTHQPLDLSDCF